MIAPYLDLDPYPTPAEFEYFHEVCRSTVCFEECRELANRLRSDKRFRAYFAAAANLFLESRAGRYGCAVGAATEAFEEILEERRKPVWVEWIGFFKKIETDC